MPDLKDFLPQPPWEGPPLPRLVKRPETKPSSEETGEQETTEKIENLSQEETHEGKGEENSQEASRGNGNVDFSIFSPEMQRQLYEYGLKWQKGIKNFYNISDEELKDKFKIKQSTGQ